MSLYAVKESTASDPGLYAPACGTAARWGQGRRAPWKGGRNRLTTPFERVRQTSAEAK